MKGQIRYVKTELGVEAPFELAHFARALGECGAVPVKTSSLGTNKWAATFRTGQTFPSAEPNITALLSTVEALNWSGQHVWRACTLRELVLHYACGDQPLALNNVLTAQTLGRMFSLGMDLRFSVVADG